MRAAVIAFAFAASAGAGAQDSVYSHDQCRRVALIDADAGAPIRGAEDLALDMRGGRVFVSAYDRHTTEKAAKTRDAAIPQGGIYVVALSQLREGSDALAVANATASFAADAQLRPHGIAFSWDEDAGPRLVVLNRVYERGASGLARRRTELVFFDVVGDALAHRLTHPDAKLCRANDLDFIGRNALAVSLDHASCGAGAIWEDVRGARRSELIGVLFDETDYAVAGYTAIASGLRFANGVAYDQSVGVVFTALTRDNAIHAFDPREAAAAARTPALAALAVSGGPDNLTLAAGARAGAVIAAIHPDLLALGRHRHGWLGGGPAGSRIVAIDPGPGVETILFDDGDGALFSAATSAVLADDLLVAGSATDEGLLVCSYPGGGDDA